MTDTPKILIARNLPDSVVAEARKFADVTYRDRPDPMTEAEMIAALRDFDGVLPTLGDRFSEAVFAQVSAPRCRILANYGVGYNHIDVAAAKARGVTVTNTPGAVTDATADIAVMLMLMACRRAGEGERLVRSQGWEGWHPVQMLGLHMTGKTLGIVGMGRIGQAIARRCHFGFGMQIAYASRSEKTLPFPADRYGSPMELAAAIDILVVAVPGGAETHHLIDAAVFRAMRPTARFVNIARGDVVDEVALIEALETGQIGGAGLDVYEFEPDVPARLRALESVVLLPHLGTAALEVREAMGHMAVDNLRAHFAGTLAPNAI